MYVYHLPHSERRDLCRILDQNNKWEELGGTYMKFDQLTMQDLRREIYRGNSPTEELLTMWGHQNHTVLELFFLLSQMKHYQAMLTIKRFVDERYHRHIQDGRRQLDNLIDELSLVRVAENKEVNVDRRSEKILNGKCMPVPRIQVNGDGAVSNEDNETRAGAVAAAPIFDQVGLKPRSPLPLEKILSAPTLTVSAISCAAESAGAIPQIPYVELQQSTNNWDKETILGKGGFGTVFKGTWKCTRVAIKRIESKADNPESHNEQIKQSITELHWLNSYRHDNILPLYGYSIGGPQPCLVYQYMSGGSLEHRLRPRDPSKTLDWKTRLNIAIGSARGLQYLHTIGDKPLIHGDIKPANILLDPNDVPRIGDFGLAREGPHQNYTHITVIRIHGTRPYLPDEFLRAHQFSTKVDTYSFGVVLFEIATSLYAYSERREHTFLKDHVIKHDGEVTELMDRRAGDDEAVFRGLVDIGKVCVQRRAKDRPEMVNVLISLEKVET